MAVNNGEPANEDTFNDSFPSKEIDDTIVAKWTLANPDSLSGSTIDNIQRGFNSLFSAVGIGINEVQNFLVTWATSFVGTASSSLVDKLNAIDKKFKGTYLAAGDSHFHTGADGDGGKISATDLDDYNDLWVAARSLFFTATLTDSQDISTELSGKIPGGGETAIGVLTDPSLNRVSILEETTNNPIEDDDGLRVYGRITESGGAWTISYFVNSAGTELPYTFTLASDLLVVYREVYASADRPTLGADIFDVSSLDVTGDVVDASTTLRGVVSTASQTLGGNKKFEDGIALGHAEDDMTVGSDVITVDKPYVYLTDPVNSEIREMVSVSGRVNLKAVSNQTGGTVIFKHMTPAGTGPIATRMFYFQDTLDFSLDDQGVAEFIYDPVNNRWNLSSGGTGGGSARVVTGFTPDPAEAVIAADGIDMIDNVAMDQIIRVIGDAAGANVIVSSDLIIPHTIPGAKLTIMGSSNDDFIVLTDAAGNGVKLLKGDWYSYDYYSITLEWDGAIWVETGRNV